MKLNLGCGTDIRKGWINLDIAKLDGIDVIHDVNNVPLPFEDNTFDYVLCQDIFEHVEYIQLLKDIRRILKTDGIIEVRVPHYNSANSYTDPTHKKLFAGLTFDFFVKDGYYNRNYYFDFSFEKILERKITFQKAKGLLFYNFLLEWFVNLSPKTIMIYERTFLKAFPSENLVVKLVK